MEYYPYQAEYEPEGCPACGFIWAFLITMSVIGVISGYLYK